MKIQLDYKTKTITLAEKVELFQLMEWCEKHLEDIKDWSLDTNQTITWTNPIYVETPVVQPYDFILRWEYRPEDSPYYGDINQVSETYNLDICLK